jgi:uncharacterized protein YegP (UPF0339 family)
MMATRPFPSFWIYKDTAGYWRWTYHARNGEAIAVSSESYVKRSDCRRGIDLMKGSSASPVWTPTDLVDAQ